MDRRGLTKSSVKGNGVINPLVREKEVGESVVWIHEQSLASPRQRPNFPTASSLKKWQVLDPARGAVEGNADAEQEHANEQQDRGLDAGASKFGVVGLRCGGFRWGRGETDSHVRNRSTDLFFGQFLAKRWHHAFAFGNALDMHGSFGLASNIGQWATGRRTRAVHGVAARTIRLVDRLAGFDLGRVVSLGPCRGRKGEHQTKDAEE